MESSCSLISSPLSNNSITELLYINTHLTDEKGNYSLVTTSLFVAVAFPHCHRFLVLLTGKSDSSAAFVAQANAELGIPCWKSYLQLSGNQQGLSRVVYTYLCLCRCVCTLLNLRCCLYGSFLQNEVMWAKIKLLCGYSEMSSLVT